MKGKKDYKNGAPQKTLLEMFLTSKPVQVDLKTFESERKETNANAKFLKIVAIHKLRDDETDGLCVPCVS